MLINGVTEYTRDGKEVKTALVVARATGNGETKTTTNGKRIASVSVKAFGRKDGSAAFLAVKSWDDADIAKISSLRKGDTFLAAGRLDSREYNGKTYTDLMADIVLTGASIAPAECAVPSTSRNEDFAETGDEDGELPF